MSYSNRLITLFCVFFAHSSHAFDMFVDGLYWKATEAVDWVYANDRAIPNQNITYETIKYDFRPGFRIGFNVENEWEYSLYYTNFYTHSSDSLEGNLVSAFLGAKIALPFLTFFYDSATIDSRINYNMLDVEMGKSICIGDNLTLKPLIGLKGGTIYQTLHSQLVSTIIVNEDIKNDFVGVGPKAGLETSVNLIGTDCYSINLLGNFSASYLWGNWKIHDTATTNLGRIINIDVDSRQSGAINLQALLGLNIDYDLFTFMLAYEVSDWFNQYQVFDDATGAHSDDLIFQGLTARFLYRIP